MGIFDRIATLFKSNINDLISRAENPEKMLDQIVLDMKSQLGKAKQQVASAIADEKRLKDQAESELKAGQDWEAKAMLAIKEGRDDLAKQALVRHNEHMEHAQQLQTTWQAHALETEKLKNSLRDLNDKIEEAKRKKNVLIARKKRAEAQKAIQETMHGLKDQSAFETFGRMEAKIDQMEAEAEAQGELAEEYSGDVLASQFSKLERAHSADEDLLALKRKMNLVPPEEQKAPAAPVQARVEAPPQQQATRSEQDELAAALEEMEAEQQAEEKRKAGR
jgi:phage shock protein A